MSYISLVIAITAIFVAGFALLVSIGVGLRVLRSESIRSAFQSRQGLPTGSPVPEEALKINVFDWRAEHAMVVFASASCEACTKLLEVLSGHAELLTGVPCLVVETAGGNDLSLRKLADFPAQWFVDREGVLGRAFATQVTPYTFYLRAGRVVDQIVGPDVVRLLEMLRKPNPLETQLLAPTPDHTLTRR
jgi:hypothetical protein